MGTFNLCVFQSSRTLHPKFQDVVKQLATLMPQYGFNLVSGGDNTPGQMQDMARIVTENGGTSLCIMPTCYGWAEHSLYGTLKCVPDMGQRKNLMIEVSDAFVILEGGLGTLDELYEVWSRRVMGEFKKPIALCVSPQFETTLRTMHELMVTNGTVSESYWDHLNFFNAPEEMLAWLRTELKTANAAPAMAE